MKHILASATMMWKGSFQERGTVLWTRDFDGFFLPQNVFGQVVSAKICVKLAANSQVRIGTNITKNGHYQVRVMNTEHDEQGKNIWKVELHKKTEVPRILIGTLIPNEFGLEENQWFTVEVHTQDGEIVVLVNGTVLLKYDDSKAQEIYEQGTIGLQFFQGSGDADMVKVEYHPAQIEALPPSNHASKFIIDFQGVEEGEKPCYWIESNAESYWKCTMLDNCVAYGTEYIQGYTHTYLHVFDKNTTAEFEFMNKGNCHTGQMGFLFRMGPESMAVRVGYDYGRNKWFLKESIPDGVSTVTTYADMQTHLLENQWHTVKIVLWEDTVSVICDGEPVLAVSGVRHKGCGRVGMFANGIPIYLRQASFVFEQGGIPTNGVCEHTPRTETMCPSMQVVELPDKRLLGVMRYKDKFLSQDRQKFEKIEGKEFENIDTRGGYPCFLRLRDGSYRWVVMDTLEVYKSYDMRSWTLVGNVLPKEQLFDEYGRQVPVFHINSLTEIVLSNGGNRLFLPLSYRMFRNTVTNNASGNYTKVFFSDDGGVTWKSSKNTTRELLYDYQVSTIDSLWAETKVIGCADGSLRLYLTRSRMGCVHFIQSWDGGETWEQMGALPEMQCAGSSYAIAEDPIQRGTYYMLWVNDTQSTYGSLMNRTRISLARSTDGMNWKFLCDLERNDSRYPDGIEDNSSLFQILDPSLLVTDNYIIATFGRSEGLIPEAVPGTWEYYHHGQKVRVVRLEKECLVERKWDSATIADMRFPKKISIKSLPNKTEYHLGESFSLEGGQVFVTALDDSISVIPMEELRILKKPEMQKTGKQEVALYSKHGMLCTFDIRIIE